MNEPMVADGFEARCQKVLLVARELHARRPDWVTFFRETLGVSGAARSVFPEQKDYSVFEQSAEFTEIQELVASLRTKKPAGKNEATRVITVRLPESLHESLKAEAADHNTSMNKLCISKLLLALIDEEAQKQAARTEAAQAAQNTPATQPAPSQMPASQPAASPYASQQPAQQQSPRQDMPSPNPSGFRSTYGQ